MSNDTRPEIRFPGFTDDWEERKLGDVSNYSNGGSYESDVENRGKYELITLKSVDMFGNLVSSGKFINKKVPTLNKGTLVMILSEQSPGLLGMTAQIPKDDTFVLNQRVAEIHPNDDTNGYFLSMAINRSQAYFSKRGAGTKVQNISKSNVENFEFFIPIKHEQQKIGTFFKNLDDTITLKQRKLDLLKETKKGFLQKMFPKNGAKVPEIRFPGFTGDWEQRKFEEIWKRTSDKNKDLRFKPTDILSVAKMKYSDSPKNSTDEYMKTYFILKKGDIAFEGNKSKDYSFGRFVLNDVADGIVSHVFITFEPIAPMDINFMKIYINNEEVMKHKLVRSTTKTLMMTTLNVKDINRQMLPIPNLEEQQKIGTFFKSLDNTIALHQRKLDLLKETKKGFLQKMFV